MSTRKKCVECGLPFSIHDRGYLYLYTKSSAEDAIEFAEIPFEELDWHLVRAGYYSKDHLKDLVQTVQHRTETEWLAYTGTEEQIKQPMIPLGKLAQRLENEQVVNFIATGQFVNHFQPIVSLSDYHVYGYESLLRSGEREINVSPVQLFEVAQNTGLNSLLDQKARETAIRSRVNNIPHGVKSFINFLPSTIYNPAFCLRHTFSVVEKYDVAPDNLVFEVVETEKINNIPLLKDILDTYKESGVKVALDDLGSGFATVEMLKTLSPDYVKIDRSYVSYCDQSREKQQFLEEVMRIARGMGIRVLAEGIERKEELEYCQSIQVDLAQGYYIGKPEAEPLREIQFN
ncbi:EAL domain-containing protein [Sediminibacillus massiliensis]|uniref:EAL domain-containing protein n=1 Tax=Sediminibacillus massiliensis TaxID=1926277 RepID=UPI0009885BC2|nr:EAL domain-containing protein [Sediminibacillus massiliensis]